MFDPPLNVYQPPFSHLQACAGVTRIGYRGIEAYRHTGVTYETYEATISVDLIGVDFERQAAAVLNFFMNLNQSRWGGGWLLRTACRRIIVSWCRIIVVSWCHGVMVSWCHGLGAGFLPRRRRLYRELGHGR